MRSILAEPRSWRPPRDEPAYHLIEFEADGQVSAEDFNAPDDAAALERARAVAETAVAEVWCERRLVARWESRPGG